GSKYSFNDDAGKRLASQSESQGLSFSTADSTLGSRSTSRASARTATLHQRRASASTSLLQIRAARERKASSSTTKGNHPRCSRKIPIRAIMPASISKPVATQRKSFEYS